MSEIEYAIGQVETFYKGYRFRSRLEARWAAFFDLCKWRWEYEPADFNGWFPDFVLLGDAGNRVYVEVKPIAERCLDLQNRIVRSGCQDECLVCGLCPTLLGTSSILCRLGWIYGDVSLGIDDNGQPIHIMDWDEALLFRPRLVGYELPYGVDFCASNLGHECRMGAPWANPTGRITGIYRDRLFDGESHIAPLPRLNVSELWGLAHEMTRYDPS